MSVKALKITAVISAALISLSAVSFQANAEDVVDNGDFKYLIAVDGKSAQLVSYMGQSLYVSVPPEVNNIPVTSIGAAAFKDNKKLKELEITGSVKKIDTMAFSGCTSLGKVHISGSVTSIGDSAFSGCSSLKDLSIDDGLLSVGRFAFSECASLEKTALPNSVDSIGDYAFINCTKLSEPNIPKGLRYFGGYALENTKWMNNQKGEFVTVGDGILIKYIGKSDIKSIPDSIKTIGSYSFAGNVNLKNVMIPSSVSTVQNSAFEGCEKLDNVYMPASVERIGKRAFYGCSSLKNIDLTDKLSVIDDYCFSESGLTDLRVPKNVTSINKGAFESCRSLSGITLGDGVKKIGEEAFKDCIQLKRVVFPKNINVIETDAFADCKNLLRVEFSGDITLNEHAFNECPELEAAVFYGNPKKLDDNAFNQVPEMIIYSDNNRYLQEYAERTDRVSEDLKNLPSFNEYMSPEKKQEDVQISVGYTLITVMIIIIDLVLIGFFVFYLLVIDRKLSGRKNRIEAEQESAQEEPVRKRPGTAVHKSNTGTAVNHPPVQRKKPAITAQEADKPIRRPSPKPAQQEKTAPDESITFASSSRKKKAPTQKKRPSDENVTYVQAPRRKTRPVQGKKLYESDTTYITPGNNKRTASNAEHTKRREQISDSEYDMEKFRGGDTMVFKKPKK